MGGRVGRRAFGLVIGGDSMKSGAAKKPRGKAAALEAADDDRTSMKISATTHRRLMLLCAMRGRGWTADKTIADLIDHAPEAALIRDFLAAQG